MSSFEFQSGGANACSANKKYKCNYTNITKGFCPGYIAKESAAFSGRNSPKEYKWYPGNPQDSRIKKPKSASGSRPRTGAREPNDSAAPKGYDFKSSDSLQLTRNGRVGNDTQCLPRNPQGKIYKRARRHKGDGETNYYCQRYRTKNRKLRGCTDNKAAAKAKSKSPRRRRKSKKKRKTPPPPLAPPPKTKVQRINDAEAEIFEASEFQKNNPNKGIAKLITSFYNHPLFRQSSKEYPDLDFQFSNNDISTKALGELELIAFQATEAVERAKAKPQQERKESKEPEEPTAVPFAVAQVPEGLNGKDIDLAVETDGNWMYNAVMSLQIDEEDMSILRDLDGLFGTGEPAFNFNFGGGGNDDLKAVLFYAHGYSYFAKGNQIYVKPHDSNVRLKVIGRSNIPKDVKKQLNRMIDAFEQSKKTIVANFVNHFVIPKQGKVIRFWNPNGDHFFYLIEQDGFELRVITKGGHRMLGLFTTRMIPDGTKIPYLGRPLTEKEEREEQDRDNYYLIEADSIGDGFSAIDGSPLTAKDSDRTEYWALSMGPFANEPSLDEKQNAMLWHKGIKAKLHGEEVSVPLLEIRRDLEAGEEVFICYGEDFERNGYETSCVQKKQKL